MVTDIIISIVGNILTIVLLGSVAYLYTILSRRRLLLSFFNLERSKKITLYLSAFYIPSGNAFDFRKLPRSYQGLALPYDEVKAYLPMYNLFTHAFPASNELKGVLQKLFVQEVDVRFLASPIDSDSIDVDGTIVSLGSPGYNSISSLLQKNSKIAIIFSDNNDKITYNDGKEIGSDVTAFIQKYKENDRTYFYVAGLNQIGTQSAINYLLINWKNLYHEFKNSNFYVALHVDNNNQNNPIIVVKEKYP